MRRSRVHGGRSVLESNSRSWCTSRSGVLRALLVKRAALFARRTAAASAHAVKRINLLTQPASVAIVPRPARSSVAETNFHVTRYGCKTSNISPR